MLGYADGIVISVRKKKQDVCKIEAGSRDRMTECLLQDQKEMTSLRIIFFWTINQIVEKETEKNLKFLIIKAS